MSVNENLIDELAATNYNPQIVAILSELSLMRYHKILRQQDETGEYFYRETTSWCDETQVETFGPFETAGEALWGINLI